MRPRMPVLAATMGLIVLAFGCRKGAPAESPYGKQPESRRDVALRSARVWEPPPVPIAEADLSQNPSGPDRFDPHQDVSCDFLETAATGTTPKFSCRLADGRVVKVKYGRTNPERITEATATRLLATLGFGADRMFVVRSVRCDGCPARPFDALRCLETIGWRGLCFAGVPADNRPVDFEAAVIERPLDGTAIESYDGQGWAWYELDRIDEAEGGSPRREVDALRLLAIVLAHWDNKAGNQRLVCRPGGTRPDGSCATPVAIIQDLGATFGPLKLDLVNWRRTPVWSDSRTCAVSMRSLPFEGATFPDRRISEAGRRLLLDLLDQLSERQLRDLFVSTGMTSFEHLTGDGFDASAWINAFRQKVREIREAGPCPG